MTPHDNLGYQRLFDDGLSFGVGFPLTNQNDTMPDVDEELRLARHAESVGFDALWARDVPTYWPSFGDAGQTFDVWPWLTQVATVTDELALGTASVVLPLRHPLHVAKAAATVDQLSGGRLVMGIASGDRDPEFPAFGVELSDRGTLFRESVELLRTVWREDYPEVESSWGTLDGEITLVPKPTTETVPLLPTGYARQTLEWIAEHGDGWLFYQLPQSTLESYLADWRDAAGDTPFSMAVQVELADDPGDGPEHIHQGFCAGTEWFRDYFSGLNEMGVDHVLVGLQSDDPEADLSRFADEVISPRS
ncbi:MULTISPECIES: TIGR03571 family LLM class oxidoreductase [Haloferax]|uniref:TIGR03571 family LLM class oxidoreductase n=2 Tax=Haloferax TaxID=2251 RepID=A0A6G1Z5Y7_9EURY|nr:MULTISPECIES: TIGR03571 family LLM class oxidoreductase [Haloferax]KAB1185403.1 TIGR03571 family LLM class oxidoreductase [Haloferax sp. CBA1149]MRW82047.1 TIGR03571 family LLM class oxidoreductase [Haloferax marinisediminis]